MKVTYPINYSGYVPILRSILLLVKGGTLSLSQLGLYICFIMQADFDIRHDRYRTILRDDKQLADEFGINLTTVWRGRKEFIKTGLLREEKGITKAPNYFMFELEKVKKLTKLPISKLHELFAYPRENFAEIEQFIANMQTDQPAIAPQSSIGPSKGSSFSVKDMEWIDNNVKEGRNV